MRILILAIAGGVLVMTVVVARHDTTRLRLSSPPPMLGNAVDVRAWLAEKKQTPQGNVSAAMFLLLRTQDLKDAVFVCPSSNAEPDFYMSNFPADTNGNALVAPTVQPSEPHAWLRQMQQREQGRRSSRVSPDAGQ